MCFSKLFGKEKEMPVLDPPPPEELPPPPEPAVPSGMERPSPPGTMPQSAVKQYSDRIKVEQQGLKLLKSIRGTNSMDPLFDRGHTLIARDSFNHEDLVEGDIVVYYAYGRYIVHRITVIAEDEQGRAYTLEGDNNNEPDPYIVRDEHIKYLVVGIVYTSEEDET